MGFLTDIPATWIPTDKAAVFVIPAFDVVLEVQQLFREEKLTEWEKLDTALKMLVKNEWNLKLFSANEKAELLNEIYNRCISMKRRPEIRKNPVPILDFEEDGEYIYASFMQDYGLDLIDMQGQLSWRKFIDLFDGLSDDTKIKRVMKIRSMEMPPFNGKNQKQIQELSELKSYYALPVRGNGGQRGLDALFAALEGMAKQ